MQSIALRHNIFYYFCFSWMPRGGILSMSKICIKVRPVSQLIAYIAHKCDKVFKNGPSKIFERLSSTSFPFSILEYFVSNGQIMGISRRDIAIISFASYSKENRFILVKLTNRVITLQFIHNIFVCNLLLYKLLRI